MGGSLAAWLARAHARARCNGGRELGPDVALPGGPVLPEPAAVLPEPAAVLTELALVLPEPTMVLAELAVVLPELEPCQQQPPGMWSFEAPAAVPRPGLPCPHSLVLLDPLGPCCQLATAFCKEGTAWIGPSLLSPSKTSTAAMCKHGYWLACMQQIVAKAGLGGRGGGGGQPGSVVGTGTGKGSMQWGQGVGPMMWLCQVAQFCPNQPWFCRNRLWFCQKHVWFWRNWLQFWRN